MLVASNHEGEMNIYRHDRSDGKTTPITAFDRPIWESVLSPECDRVAYAANESEETSNRDVYVADSNGANARCLEIGTTGAEATPQDWSPDGGSLLVSDNTEDRTRCGIYDFGTDEVRWYGTHVHEESAAFFMPDGERFLASRMQDATVAPVVYDVETGDVRTLDLPDVVAWFGWRSARVLGENRVLVSHTTPLDVLNSSRTTSTRTSTSRFSSANTAISHPRSSWTPNTSLSSPTEYHKRVKLL